jgi:hypothetical protein
MPDQTINHYQTIMADPVRMRAYQEAIQRTCRGKTVCEVGVGLGPLSLMALKAGATKVYGIEMDAAALEVAIRVLRDNGFDASRFIPIHGISHRVDLPERVDVVLFETLNSVAFGENALFYLEDAQRRFLKPGGKMVPQSLTCCAALGSPVTSSQSKSSSREARSRASTSSPTSNTFRRPASSPLAASPTCANGSSELVILDPLNGGPPTGSPQQGDAMYVLTPRNVRTDIATRRPRRKAPARIGFDATRAARDRDGFARSRTPGKPDRPRGSRRKSSSAPR